MIVVNGRLSERSFRRWQIVPGVIAALLSRFDLCLAQSAADAERYGALGAPRVTSTGNLKLDVPAPPVDETTLRQLKLTVGMRPVVAAASTHPGEETAIITAHRRLRAKHPALSDRHRAAPSGARRDNRRDRQGRRLIGRRCARAAKRRCLTIDVYVADTLGELGLIYRLAPIVFMGGSLVEHGGQNPIEAIRLGAAVLHGPHVWNFAEIYATLDEAHGAEARRRRRGARPCGSTPGSPIRRRARRSPTPAPKPCDRLGGALDRTLAALDPYLMQLRLEQRAS